MYCLRERYGIYVMRRLEMIILKHQQQQQQAQGETPQRNNNHKRVAHTKNKPQNGARPVCIDQRSFCQLDFMYIIDKKALNALTHTFIYCLCSAARNKNGKRDYF